MQPVLKAHGIAIVFPVLRLDLSVKLISFLGFMVELLAFTTSHLINV